MRLSKFARVLIGITSLFVTGVYLEENCVVLPVKTSWRLPRCSQCGRICAGYDHRHEPVRWVHLGIGAMRFILEYAPRRVQCPSCGVRVEMVPWARPGSRFTKPFEEMTAYLAQITDKSEVSRIMGISWRTVGNIVERVVAERLDPKRLDGLKRLGVDEFSYRKRHRYITTVVDHDRHQIVWAAEGKSSETLDAFFDELGQDRAGQIEFITIDMSAAFIKSIKANLLKESLAAVFEKTDPDDAERELDRWLAWASRSKLQPFVKTARTIREHKSGILAYVETKLTNGLAEGLNNMLRMIARRAFGFHSAYALIGMLFLCCGGVNLDPPLPGPWC